MATKLKNALWFGVSTAIILGMVYFADVGSVTKALSTAELPLLAPAFVFGLSVFGVWSFVWYRFFQQMELGINFRKSVLMFMSGHFLNSITPLGQFGGEPVMAYIVSKNSEASYEEAFSAVLSGDIVNGIPSLTFVIGGGLYMLLFRSVTDFILQGIAVVFLGTLVGSFLIYLLWFEGGVVEGFLLSVARKISGIVGFGSSLVDQLDKSLEKMEKSLKTVGENPWKLLEVVVIAHLGFVFQVLCLYFIIMAFGFESGLVPLYFIVTFVALANFSPTPGGSGTFEGAMAFLISEVFLPVIPFHTGLLAAIIFRLTTYWPGLLIGYVALNKIEYSR